MKRFFSLILLLTLLTGLSAGAEAIYTYEEEIPIAKSISLRRVESFYAGRNIAYSVIRADLSDKNTSLRLLKSEAGVDTLDTVSNLAKTEENVVAAMNGDFFSLHKGNKALSLGIEVRDGELLSSPINPTTMATVSYMDDILSMSYLDFHLMAVAPNGEYCEVRHMNKHTAYFGDILLYTPAFGSLSPAPGGEVLEVVVEDGKIREFRRNLPPVEIPENGCVLVVSEGVNMFFANNFAVGDPIRFDYYITPDVKDADAAFGGGAILVENGKALTTFSHTVDGYNPRSAIGTDESGKILYLVAVDGRQKSSRGLTMEELARLMQSLGCFTAVNLDGGGSTRMLASTVWDESMHAVHSPTENRPVINAVGLTYNGKAGKPAGILLESETPTVFLGDSVRISAATYDTNMRPLQEKITLSARGGTLAGDIFTPTRGGVCTVEARLDSVREEIEIFVVDEIQGIEIPSHIRLECGQTADLPVSVYDAAGHYVPCGDISAFTITSSNPAVAFWDGEKITAGEAGTAILSVSFGDAKSYAAVAVGTREEAVSLPLAFSDERGGKLCYTFENEDTATFTLAEKSTVSDTCDTVSAEVFTNEDFPHAVSLALSDKNGNAVFVPFVGEVKKGETSALIATLPKEAARPLSLTGLCVVPSEEKEEGEIFFESLSYTVDMPHSFPALPQNEYRIEAEKDADFAVGAFVRGDSLFAGLMNDKTEKVLGDFPKSAALHSDMIFSAQEAGDALYITLNTEKGSIRATDSSAWEKLSAAISETKKQNIFLLTSSSVFGQDAFEDRVVKDFLASLPRNVFVVSRGEENAAKNIGGVWYLSLGASPEEAIGADAIRARKILTFSLGKTPTFSFCTLY